MTYLLRAAVAAMFVAAPLSCQDAPSPRTAFSLTKEHTGMDVPESTEVIEFNDGYLHNGQVMPEGSFKAKFLLPDSLLGQADSLVRSGGFVDVQGTDSIARWVRDILPAEKTGVAQMTFGRISDNFQIVFFNRAERTLVIYRQQISSKF